MEVRGEGREGRDCHASKFDSSGGVGWRNLMINTKAKILVNTVISVYFVLAERLPGSKKHDHFWCSEH